ncbi:MAG: hypothetical protein RLN76_05500 [Phycisphaeraceae bacterium]
MSISDIIFWVTMLLFVVGPAIAGALKSMNEERARKQQREDEAFNDPGDGLTVQQRVDQKSAERRAAMLQERTERQERARRKLLEDGTLVQEPTRAQAGQQPGNLSPNEAQARARAQEAYRRRAEALRQRDAARQAQQRTPSQQRSSSPQPQQRPAPAPPQRPVQQTPKRQPSAQQQPQRRAQPLAQSQAVRVQPQQQRRSQLSQQQRPRQHTDVVIPSSLTPEKTPRQKRVHAALRNGERLRDLIVLKEILDAPVALRQHHLS